MDDPIKRKIAALMKMTRRAGCTEAEAMAAAEKAAALMAEHGLSEADLVFTSEKARSKTMGGGRRDRTWEALAYCTNTALLYRRGEVEFIGRGAGPQVAAYLYKVLDRAMDAALAEFKAFQNYRRRQSIKSRRAAADDFIDAMGMRLRLKLWVLFKETMSDTDRRSAVMARDRLFPNALPTQGKVPTRGRNKVAQAAGNYAGGQVQLAHGMAGRDDVLQLEGRV